MTKHPTNIATIAELDREYARVARLLDAAEVRMGESWDKPRGTQDRIERTVRKHRRTLAQLDARAKQLDA